MTLATSSAERDRAQNHVVREILVLAEKRIHAINSAASDPARNPAVREMLALVQAENGMTIDPARAGENPAAVSRPRILVEA